MIPTLTNPLGIPPYKRLQYLESTGTQYIDTGYVFDAADKGSELEIELYMPPGVTGANVTFGARQQSNGRNSLYIIGYNLIVGDSLDVSVVSSAIPSGQVVFRFADGKYSVNGGAAVDVGRLPATQYQFGLFTFNTQGYFPSNVMAKTGTRIYCCRFYENGVLVHNFIPVLDNDSVPCMYDTVTRIFKYNAGTGTFNYA